MNFGSLATLDLSDTRETRLQAAQTFVEGDRVRHNITGKLGKFIEVNLGFALPEVWIEFDSETEIHIPLSCNPLLVEVVDKNYARQRVIGEPVLLENKDLCESELQAFLTPGELPIESNEQSTDDTQEERVAVVPEVLEELSTDSSNYKLKTEPKEKINQEVIARAAIDDTQVVAAEVVEELSEQEEAERHRLELKVERAFVEAGWALQELRDRRLYRNTHNSFEDYCRDRFGMNRSRSYQLIDAATVFDNLTECPQIVDILPTNESQCRPLIQLEPDEQREAWQQAVKAVDGKVPSGRIVKSIVQRLKERGITPLSNLLPLIRKPKLGRGVRALSLVLSRLFLILP